MKKLLVLRPEPAASETAARARALGLEPLVAPLFTILPLDWVPPDPAAFDAVMVTSANAVRHGGAGLAQFRSLPCYAVGERSAAAAAAAGFPDVRTGPGDGAALVARMAAEGVRSAFHPCGRERMPLAAPGLRIMDVPVYAAEPAGRLPADPDGTLVLLHSPLAAARFASFVPEGRERIAIAAISRAAAEAAGSGWGDVAIAGRPRDEALLELAAKLCQNGASGEQGPCG